MDFRKHTAQQSLDGVWQFAFSAELPPQPIQDLAALQSSGMTLYPATVPGNFELDLHANGIIEDPFFGMNIAALRQYEHTHLWYACRFETKPELNRKQLLLFEGLDCFADIYLNGTYLGSTDNMLVEHLFPVSVGETNELVIHIRPAIEEAQEYPQNPLLFAGPGRYESLFVRKAPHSYGWDIMPRALSAGIWRSVRLLSLPIEHLETVYLETLHIASDHSSARLLLHVQAELEGPFWTESGQPVYEIEIEGVCGEDTFHTCQPLLFSAGRVNLSVSHPHLWWPKGRGPANLYEVEVRLIKNGEPIDSLHFTHGIRTVELLRTSITDATGSGEFCFRVNGERVFIHGSNWVPADAFHSRDAARIPAILEMADDLNCNMLRCWGGNVYENDLFYDLCDQKGILIWQDFTMACAVYPQDTAFCEQLQEEARKVVRRLRQHPCIALWAGDNECDQAYSWGGRRQDPNANVLTREVLPQVLREEDASRPYLPSSPYIDATAYAAGERYLSENHLWGPRDYYKSAYYTQSLCHFASEIGYHGCPSPESIRKFISPDKIWPCTVNPEWILHSTSPIPGINLYDYRVELMAKQVRELFGTVPDTLEDFASACET